MEKRVRIGLVDSGCSQEQFVHCAGSAAFVLDGDNVNTLPATADSLCHGSRVAAILLHVAPQAELVVAQVFRERLTTSAAQVAAAIDWLLGREVAVINLSLGLREARPVLGQACARALQAGAVLCASAPAHGAPVYPAAFPGILRVTGDARCALGEIAAIGAAHADFGAHVMPLDGDMRAAGASMACAHLSAQAARHFSTGGDATSLRAALAAQARYHGIDRPGR